MATQANALPITVYKVIGSADAHPLARRIGEIATLSIKAGTPVRVAAGVVDEMDTVDGLDDLIAGFSYEAGHSLGTAGTAPVGGSGTTYGSVPNQSAAKNIPIGAPMADGTLGFFVACDTTIFLGKSDDAHTVAIGDVGTLYNLTKVAATGYWFIDTSNSTAASGACVEIVEIPDGQLGVVGGMLAFRVTRAYQQLFT